MPLRCLTKLLIILFSKSQRNKSQVYLISLFKNKTRKRKSLKNILSNILECSVMAAESIPFLVLGTSVLFVQTLTTAPNVNTILVMITPCLRLENPTVLLHSWLLCLTKSKTANKKIQQNKKQVTDTVMIITNIKLANSRRN